MTTRPPAVLDAFTVRGTPSAVQGRPAGPEAGIVGTGTPFPP